MQCELCGREITSPRYVIIDNVKMAVCQECAKYGKPVSPPPAERIRKVIVKKTRPRIDEEIFKSMKKVLVPDWAERIKEAREKKGLSREELGARIGEPTVAIAKMENRDLRPSDDTIRKLEKTLGITLFQELDEVHLAAKSRSASGLTLGDLIKIEKEEHE